MYEYECTKCGGRFELIQKFSDEPIKLHSQEVAGDCDGEVKKLLSAPAIKFKGSGWYVNDYGKGGVLPKKSGEDSSNGSKDSGDSKDSKGSKETKSESSDKSSSDSKAKSDSGTKTESSKSTSKSLSSD